MDARVRSAYERALWSVPAELPTNLPLPRSGLVGREREIAHIESALTAHSGVVLVGPAGIGKSRLALEIGRRLLPKFPDGAWWCDLTNAASAEQMYAVLADAARLNVPAADIESVYACMRRRVMLIILDRCESVTEAVGQFVSRLHSECDGVRVLMTSQRPVEAAHAIRIPNLSLPPNRTVQRKDVLDSEAVRLFVERAVAVDGSFTITDENASTVAQICRAVEGSPFAIEIASAYLAHAGVQEVARRIGAHALRDVDKAAHASVDWAYQLLAPDDAMLLRSVSVFPGYWTIDDADAVSGSDASAGIQRLVSISLVVADRTRSGLTRYRLLDATRRYAYERLAGAAELVTVRVRFVERMITVVSELLAVHRPVPDAMQLAVNLHQALQLGIVEDACLEPALQVCATLGSQVRLLTVLPSAFQLVKDLLACARRKGLARSTIYADSLSACAWLANYAGDHALANDLHAEAIASARLDEDRLRLARALSAALPPLLNSRRYEDAKKLAEEALVNGTVADDVLACADALRGLSAVEYFSGRYEQAKRYYERFMELPQDRIPRARIALMLNGFSAIMARGGDYTRACAAVERALEIAYENQDYGSAAHGEKNLGYFLLAEGQLLKGHEALRRAVSLSQMSANRLTQVDALEELAASSIRKDQFEVIAYVLGYVDAERNRVGFQTDGAQHQRVQRIRSVVRRLLGPPSYQAAYARGELATQSEVFAAVSRLLPGDDTLENLDRFGELSAREREVAELAAQGLTNRAIADELSVSVRTVDAHMATIFRKLGIDRREQL